MSQRISCASSRVKRSQSNRRSDSKKRHTSRPYPPYPCLSSVLRSLKDLATKSETQRVHVSELTNRIKALCPKWRADQNDSERLIREFLEEGELLKRCQQVVEGVWKIRRDGARSERETGSHEPEFQNLAPLEPERICGTTMTNCEEGGPLLKQPLELPEPEKSNISEQPIEGPMDMIIEKPQKSKPYTGEQTKQVQQDTKELAFRGNTASSGRSRDLCDKCRRSSSSNHSMKGMSNRRLTSLICDLLQKDERQYGCVHCFCDDCLSVKTDRRLKCRRVGRQCRDVECNLSSASVSSTATTTASTSAASGKKCDRNMEVILKHLRRAFRIRQSESQIVPEKSGQDVVGSKDALTNSQGRQRG